jgi:hypothetical protein
MPALTHTVEGRATLEHFFRECGPMPTCGMAKEKAPDRKTLRRRMPEAAALLLFRRGTLQ